MHALMELIATMVAALFAAALSQMGVDLAPENARSEPREVRRTVQARAADTTAAVQVKAQDC